ncbi:MAG: nucleotidyltransferase family protein [Candidatus Acidiferrales bacterium]
MLGARAIEIQPEVQLILSCARTRLTASHTERIRRLLRPDLNWAAILALAEESGVTPLVFRHLSNVGARVPSLWLERLEKVTRANTIRTMYLTGELLRVTERFASRGIPAIPYKGPALAAQAYGDVALRQFHDVDIIVPQRLMASAHEHMLSLGYRARFPWPHDAEPSSVRIPGEYTYRGGNNQSLIELHTEWTMRHFPVRPDLEALGKRLVSVSLGGQSVATFCAEDALPILCIHGAKDFWERLSWVVDIAELIATSSGLNWNAAFENARALKSERMLLLGLTLAHNCVDAPLAHSFVERLEADSVVTDLAEEVSRRLLSGGRTSWHAKDRFRFRYRLMERPTDGIRYVWRLATAPAEDEWSAAQGSAWSARIQAALRPLRLLRRHGVAVSHPDKGPFEVS